MAVYEFALSNPGDRTKVVRGQIQVGESEVSIRAFPSGDVEVLYGFDYVQALGNGDLRGDGSETDEELVEENSQGGSTPDATGDDNAAGEEKD